MIVTKLLEFEHQDMLEHVKKRKPNEIYVTELTECPKKREFRKNLWFLETTKPSFIIGKLIHIGLQEFIRILFPDSKVETELEVSKLFENVLIKGRIDAIIDDVVVEIKYARGIKGELPLLHHEEQIQVYGWLTGLTDGIIVYVTPDGVKEYELELTYNDNNIYRLLNDKRVPRYEWECSYCVYSNWCPFNIMHQKVKKK